MTQFVHPSRDLPKLFHHRLDSLRTDTEFFYQNHALAATESKLPADPSLLGFVRLLVDQLAEVGRVLIQQAFQRGEVVRHPADDLIFFQVLSDGDLNRTIER